MFIALALGLPTASGFVRSTSGFEIAEIVRNDTYRGPRNCGASTRELARGSRSNTGNRIAHRLRRHRNRAIAEVLK